MKILLIPQIGDMFLKEKLNTLRLDFVFMNNSELCTKSSEFLNDMVQHFFKLIFFNFLFFRGIVGTVSQMNMHFMNRMVSSCPPLSTFKTFGTCNKKVINLCLISLFERLGC